MTNANGRSSQRHPDEQELIRVAAASAALRRLLAAAAAPPSAAELRGRSRAIAAFRAARQPGAHSQLVDQAAAHGGSGRRGAAKLARAGRRSAARLTVAFTALIVLLGGTAAAAAGELPTALRDAVSDLLTHPSPAPDHPAPADSSAPRVVPSAQRSAVASSSPPVRSPAAGGQPGSAASPPQLAGLCRAYQAAGPSSATLDRPGFAPLVSAAGGAGGVTAFCAGHGPAKAALAPTARPRPTPPKTARSHPAGMSTAAPAGGASPGQPAAAAPGQPRQAHARAQAQAGRQPARHVGR